MLQSPFQKLTIECPMCKAENDYFRIRYPIVKESERDVDMHPNKIKWPDNVRSHPHPPLYYVWSCPECHFTIANSSFEDPVKESTLGLSTFKKRIRDAHDIPKFKKFVSSVCTTFDPENINYFKAYKLHVLAIVHLLYVEEIINRDCMEIGRYYLRIAWLFRELDNDPAEKERHENNIKSFIDEYKKDWPFIPANEKEAMLKSAEFYKKALEHSYVIESPLDEVKYSLLIARIFLRLKMLPEAKELIFKARERTMKFERKRKEIMHRKGKKMNEEKAYDMSSISQKMRGMVDTVQVIYEKMILEQEDNITDKAKKIIEMHKNETKESIRKILLKHDIPKAIILKLVPKEAPKKKGLFGFLK